MHLAVGIHDAPGRVFVYPGRSHVVPRPAQEGGPRRIVLQQPVEDVPPPDTGPAENPGQNQGPDAAMLKAGPMRRKRRRFMGLRV